MGSSGIHDGVVKTIGFLLGRIGLCCSETVDAMCRERSWIEATKAKQESAGVCYVEGKGPRALDAGGSWI